MRSLSKETLKIFWQESMKYKWHVFAITLLLVVSVSAETTGPYLYKQFINLLASYDFNNYGKLLFILGSILVVRTVRSYSYRARDLVNDYFEPRVMADLTNKCFDYLHQNSYSFFSSNFVGSLVNKVKKFERAFETVTDRIFDDFLRTFLAIAFAVAVLSLRYWLLGVAVVVWCAIYLSAIYFVSVKKIMKYNMQKSDLDTKITGQLADTITNNVNIKLFSAFFREQGSLREITERHFKIRRYSWDLMTYLEVLQGTLMLALEGLMMYLGIKFWRAKILTVGDFTLIQLYLMSIFDKLWGMGKQFRAFYEALADANEMTEILLTPHEVNDSAGAVTLKVNEGKIEYKNVNFGYHDASSVLENFNLTIQPGERVALIGPSGGGKSTIVKLLFRFHDVQGGQILIDGQNIAKATQDSLRDNLSLVPQDPILFHRSLLENIRYGKPEATDEEVMAAAKAAHAHEFINQSREGYQTYVGERGIKLSGGERQRVAIARAILKDAPILVLDEATSSLDSESEHLIQDALSKLMRNKTVIVIAHRLSTIMQMDRIVVLEHGRVTEQGKHQELLKIKAGTYQKLWEIQAGGFAAA